MTILKHIRRAKQKTVPCAVHEFNDRWEFCLKCGLYKRVIPKSKGGYVDG